MGRTTSLHVLRCGALLALAAAAATAQTAPLRLSKAAFGGRAMVEVLGLDASAAQAVAIAALDTIRELEELTAPQSAVAGGVGALNRAAGGAPVHVQPRLLRLLERALYVCNFSNGAHGPLGGELYILWGLRSPVAGLPSPQRLEAARAGAGCDRLRLDLGQGTAQLGAGSTIDLWGFAAGFAVDEAVAVLKAAGVPSGWASAGGVERGFGAGPGGSGWPAALPTPRNASHPGPRLHLVEQALGVADGTSARFLVGGESHPAFLDQRRGLPPGGMLFAAAVTDLGVDAQGLAVVAFVLGSREAQYRLGSVRPRPAVYWAMGGGEAEPVVSSFGWSRLRQN